MAKSLDLFGLELDSFGDLFSNVPFYIMVSNNVDPNSTKRTAIKDDNYITQWDEILRFPIPPNRPDFALRFLLRGHVDVAEASVSLRQLTDRSDFSHNAAFVYRAKVSWVGESERIASLEFHYRLVEDKEAPERQTVYRLREPLPEKRSVMDDVGVMLKYVLPKVGAYAVGVFSLSVIRAAFIVGLHDGRD